MGGEVAECLLSHLESIRVDALLASYQLLLILRCPGSCSARRLCYVPARDVDRTVPAAAAVPWCPGGGGDLDGQGGGLDAAGCYWAGHVVGGWR